ncbi:MAG: hypothetical protein QG570_576 [Patescibacteria group bacterium]|nr:hypothetical protein [Patescibacteria group bacterium]
MKLPIKKKPTTTKNGSPDDFLVLDITDNSVKSLFISGASQPYTIKGASVKSSYLKEEFDHVVSQSVRECFVQADAETTNTIVGLGGPNVFGFMLILKINRSDSSKPVTEKELDGFYSKVKDISEKQARQRWAVFHPDDNDFVPLDMVVTSFETDEGKVEDPVGKNVSYVQIAVYCSYAVKSFYAKVVNTLSTLGIEPLTITTTLYSQVKLLSEEHKNYILVDIGGEYTDVAVIFGKDIVQTKSFQIGGNYFTEHLSNSMGLDFKKAQGKKESYSLNSVSDDEHDSVGDVLYESGKDWRSALETTLSSMTGIKSFPSKIFLSGGGANLPLIEELLYEEDWKQSIPFANSLEIEKVGNKYWSEIVDDELKLIGGTMFFVPASLCAVRIELSSPE